MTSDKKQGVEITKADVLGGEGVIVTGGTALNDQFFESTEHVVVLGGCEEDASLTEIHAMCHADYLAQEKYKQQFHDDVWKRDYGWLI